MWSDARLSLLTCWRRWIQQRPPPCRPHSTSEIGVCPRAHARSRGDGSGRARQDAVDAVPDGVGVNETDEEKINKDEEKINKVEEKINKHVSTGD